MKFILLSLFAGFVSYSQLVSAGVTADDKKNEILLAHNQYRNMHGAPDLELNTEMNTAAQKWAESLALLDESLMHRPRPKYGENLWMAEEARLEDLMKDDLNPVRDWYIERDHYPGHFDNSTYQKYGHFSQVVWKKTTHLGVGIAQSEKGNLYVVCNYDPKGNVVEAFQENVKPVLEEYADLNITDPFNVFPVKSGSVSLKYPWVMFIFSSALVLLR